MWSRQVYIRSWSNILFGESLRGDCPVFLAQFWTPGYIYHAERWSLPQISFFKTKQHCKGQPNSQHRQNSMKHDKESTACVCSMGLNHNMKRVSHTNISANLLRYRHRLGTNTDFIFWTLVEYIWQSTSPDVSFVNGLCMFKKIGICKCVCICLAFQTEMQKMEPTNNWWPVILNFLTCDFELVSIMPLYKFLAATAFEILCTTLVASP